MRILSVMVLLGGIVASSLVQAGDISLWREPKPVIKEGKYYSLIVDRGELQKAIKNSNNEYLFSEKGAGVKPLVLIGTPVEISDFMLQNETRGIENDIKELPNIYMGIARYVPQKRFTGLFPLQDLLVKTVDQALKFVPVGSIITDAAGMPSDVGALRDVILSMKQKEKASGELLYVKFSYLPEEGMRQVGVRSVSFGRILQQIQNLK